MNQDLLAASAAQGLNFLPSGQGLFDILSAYCAETESPPDQTLVQFVAKGRTNFLFRGPCPVRDSQLDADALNDHLRRLTPLPARYHLITINLGNDLLLREREAAQISRAYWTRHPDLGRVMSHAIYGSISDPADHPAEKREPLSRLPSLDRQSELVALINQLLIGGSPAAGPYVIYVYCHNGKDRTGQVIAAYAMQFLQQSYAQALEAARGVAQRPLTCFNERAVRWYAHYLRDVLGVQSVGEIG